MLLCVFASIQFVTKQVPNHKRKIFSWSCMTGHDVFRWHWALHLLCHWTVWFRNKEFFFSLESSFFAERFTDILGFSQYKVKWSNKCMNIRAVFSVCKTKNSLQAHRTCKIPCHSKAPGEIMKHEKPFRQNLQDLTCSLALSNVLKGHKCAALEHAVQWSVIGRSEDKQEILVKLLPS